MSNPTFELAREIMSRPSVTPEDGVAQIEGRLRRVMR